MCDFHVHYCGATVHVDEWDEHLAECDPNDLEPLVYSVPVPASTTGSYQ